MGTIYTTSIITKGREILLDTAGERWSDSQLMGYLNEGQRAVPTFKPNAYVTNSSVSVAAGTKQTLPTAATVLVDIPRNVGGRVVRLVSRKLLDAKAPNWHQADADAEVRHFMYDIEDPRHYYVYPPNDGTGVVEMIHGAIPPDVVIGQAIALDDIYEIPLLNYMLYRAFSWDAEFSADQGRADKHLTAFIAALTGKANGEAGAKPAP